ncbi:MAG: Os1348 family NHLP clan protein [Chloroflexota bacterium]|nr:Os1348 family NHLP clan protein [Chloroflexota bacterium]
MSKEALAKVVQRAISDAAFRRQLNSDPAGALRGFDLSADEMSAIRTGDAGRLTTLGVDQRMSKAYGLGGGIASTRSAASDLTSGGGPAMVDDASGAVGKTSFPGDPTRPGGSADVDGGAASGTSTVRVGDDYKFAGRQAPDDSSSGTVRAGDDYKFAGRQAPDAGASTARVGDDWKFDRTASQGSVAPVEGSPEATAAENASSRGMAAYPAHDGLAGPSGAQSVRAGDDWARSSAAAADSGRIGTARLDDASGGASGGATVIHDDPNGFLAANADAGDAYDRANVIGVDPNGSLAANADAAAGTSRGDGTAFLDESESYLTKVGYDASAAASTPNADATWSGDDIAGPSSIADDTGDGGHTATEGGPNITP